MGYGFSKFKIFGGKEMGKKRYRWLAYLMIVAFLFTACGKENVVATVNGEKITEKQFNARLEQMANLYGYDLNSEEGKEIKAFLQEQVLDSLIEETVLVQAAQNEKISYSKKELEEEIENFKKNFPNEADYKKYLDERKLTEEDVRDILYKGALIDQLYNKVTSGITQSSQDAEEYYNENKEEFVLPERVSVRHILVETEEEAREIIKRLNEGEDFIELVKEKSIDPPAKENEGFYGPFSREENFYEEFKEAAFGLKEVGDYTKTPVQTVGGYHIIKLESREEEKQSTFEEVKDWIEQQFLAREKSIKFEEYKNDLMEKAEIVKNLSSANEKDKTGEEEAEADLPSEAPASDADSASDGEQE